MSKHEENKLKKIASIKCRVEFLNEFKEHQEDYAKDSELLTALSNQANWAKYSGYNFIPMSLNSYVKVTEVNFYGGFKAVDKLRISALLIINDFLKSKDITPRKIRSDTKEGMQITINSQKKQLSIVREANIVLSKAIEVTVDALDKLAKETSDNDIKDTIEDEIFQVKLLLRRGFKLIDLDLQKEGDTTSEKA